MKIILKCYVKYFGHPSEVNKYLGILWAVCKEKSENIWFYCNHWNKILACDNFFLTLTFFSFKLDHVIYTIFIERIIIL